MKASVIDYYLNKPDPVAFVEIPEVSTVNTVTMLMVTDAYVEKHIKTDQVFSTHQRVAMVFGGTLARNPLASGVRLKNAATHCLHPDPTPCRNDDTLQSPCLFSNCMLKQT